MNQDNATTSSYALLFNYRSVGIGLNAARLGPAHTLSVPVMLHYQPSFIRFTGLKRDGAWPVGRPMGHHTAARGPHCKTSHPDETPSRQLIWKE